MGYIEFPKMGVRIPINREAFNIFGLPVYWYGIIIAAGFFLAVLLGMRNSKKAGIKQDDIIDVVLFAAPAAIVGARLYYVLFNWNEFNGDFFKIINIRTGGLAIYGGLISAIAVAVLFTRRRKINTLHFVDFCIPYFILAQAIGRWGNFANQEAFGTNTNLPWGMTGDGITQQLKILSDAGVGVDPSLPVHPTFLYESLWNLGVFLILIWFSKRKKLNGEVFCLYMMGYGAGRFWIEGLRLDSLYIGSYRISKLLSIVFVVVFGLIFVIRRLRYKEPEITVENEEKSEYSALLDELKDNPESENVKTAVSGEEKERVGENIEIKDKKMD